MTPAEIKDAYKTSLATLATLATTRADAEVVYNTACAAYSAELLNNASLKHQLDACITDGTL